MRTLKVLRDKANGLDTDRYSHVYHGSEILLSYSILRDLQSDSNLERLFRASPDLLKFAAIVIDHVEQLSLQENKVDMKQFDPMGNDLGDFLQDNLAHEDRKTLASNYTEDVGRLMQVANLPMSPASVCDHFCGSGNLIVGYLIHQGRSPWPKVRINDLMPSAVLIAFWRVHRSFPHVDIEASVGDGFSVRSKFDLILINPPYTRSHRISLNVLEHLQPIIDKYPDYNAGQAGLHVWAILSLGYLLSDSGHALLVLPRATLNARYSVLLKDFLLDHSFEISLFEAEMHKAFSRGSELRELLMSIGPQGSNVSFYSIDGQGRPSLLNRLSHDEIRQEWNWGRFFLNNDVIGLSSRVKSKFSTSTREQVGLRITRGIEMYGPQFFFFPNSRFTAEFGDDVVLTDKKEDAQFRLHPSFFSRILRKPNLYQRTPTPLVNHYVIQAPNLQDPEVSSFFNHIKSEASVAVKRFGESWFRHPVDQIRSKSPQGQIFVIDKLDLNRTPTLAYYTDEELLCTKNFYVIDAGSPQKNYLLAAWLNSTFYLLLYLTHRREIGGTYGRLQIIDYSHHELFIHLDSIDGINRLKQAFDDLRTTSLGPIPDQIFSPQRLELDRALAEFFDVGINVNMLHKEVKTLLAQLNKV